MDFMILSHVNYVAVAVCTVIAFFLGSLWFSFLFSKIWVQELSLHNVIIQAPSQRKLFMNMSLTILKEFVTSLALACLVVMTESRTVQSGLLLGSIVAFGFIATAIGLVFTWENRSMKLFLIDAGYQMIAVVLLAVILSVWH